MPAPRLLRDRALVWLLTGPAGRLGAFLADLGGYWWRWARGRIGATLRRQD